MCGIIGYVGNKESKDVLISSLEKLEYRGYDSSGISLIENAQLLTFKKTGKVEILKHSLENRKFNSNIGIGHTRWATHGKVSIENAHPHNSLNNKISLVHNGIIENYLELKIELEKHNVSFYGKTDTEVLVKYLEYIYTTPLESLKKLRNIIKGSYAIGVIFLDDPDKIYFLKKDSPLLIGIGTNENYLSSDYSSIDNYTNKVIYLQDYQYGYITKNEYHIYNENETNAIIHQLPSTHNIINNKIYSTYLEKEIHESKDIISSILRRYVKDKTIDFSSHLINKIKNNINHINILGCGSSYNVGLIGKHIIENLCKIPVSVHIASEYKYNHPLSLVNSLDIYISQSGETADLIACTNIFSSYKIGIINTKNSTLSNKMDDNFFLEAGKEVSVATTKAYIGQLTFLILIALYLSNDYSNYLSELKSLPSKIKYILDNHQEIINLSKIIKDYKNIFFIGRGLDYLTCIEGSLKLKEITYIHSEAISSGELKHGTISLIDENVYVISLLSSSLKEKTLSNIEEVKARGGKVFTISTSNSDYTIPQTNEIFFPFLEIIPLQLLSLYTGLEKKLDIDKPRNLAKSVTVE